MSSSFSDAEKNELNIGETASRAMTEAETLAEDQPQTLNAPLSDMEKADDPKGKKKPGATWKEGEVQEIPHK